MLIRLLYKSREHNFVFSSQASKRNNKKSLIPETLKSHECHCHNYLHRYTNNCMSIFISHLSSFLTLRFSQQKNLIFLKNKEAKQAKRHVLCFCKEKYPYPYPSIPPRKLPRKIEHEHYTTSIASHSIPLLPSGKVKNCSSEVSQVKEDQQKKFLCDVMHRSLTCLDFVFFRLSFF